MVPGEGDALWQEIDTTTVESMRVGVGVKDAAPTGGTWQLSANGSTSGMTALSYAITAAALQTALNAVLGASAVSVTLTGNVYQITVAAPNTSVTFLTDAAALQPQSSAQVANPVAAATGVQAIYTIALTQSPYGYSETWTARDTSADGIAIAAVSAGTSTVPAQYRVTISPDPNGGAWRFLWGQPQTVKLSCQANTAVAQVWSITTRDDSASDLAGTYFDLSDANGPVRIWYNFGGATVPAAASNQIGTITSADSGAYTITVSAAVTSGVPINLTGSLPNPLAASTNYYPLSTGTTVQLSLTSGGAAIHLTTTTAGGGVNVSRIVAVTTVIANDVAAIVSSKTADALNVDASFLNGCTVNSSGLLTVTAAASGIRSRTSSGTSGFVVSASTTGTNGDMAGAGFVLDDYNGTVGVYITVGGLPATVPTFAADCTRQIAIAMAAGASASTVASTIDTALSSDSEFSGTTSSGALVTIPDTKNGERAGTTTASSGYFSLTVAQVGVSLVGTFSWQVAAEDIASLAVGTGTLGDWWNVVKTDDFQWIFTAVALGTPPAPTVDDGTLTWLVGFEGILPFNTLSLQQAFTATSDASLNTFLEVKLTLTGEDERVALQVPTTCTRDLLGTGTLVVPLYNSATSVLWLPTVTGYTGGGATNLDGYATADIPDSRLPIAAFFAHATLGGQLYTLVSGTTAESSPSYIRPDDYNASTNARVWIKLL